MKLRIVSDIHSEFWNFAPSNSDKYGRVLNSILPVMEDDVEQTLVVAGDLVAMSVRHALPTVMAHLSKRFKRVLYIPGNHEYYNSPGRGDILDMQDTVSFLRNECAMFDNVFFSEYGRFQVEGSPVIHMATLWTDFDGRDDTSIFFAEQMMNDYRCIFSKYPTCVTGAEILGRHDRHLAMLRDNVKQGDIVVTHHLPSFKSIDPSYTRSPVNGAYASNLEDFILAAQPSLWIHGHTHVAKDYMIGNTRILCNPRGYDDQYLTNGYNGKLVVEV